MKPLDHEALVGHIANRLQFVEADYDLLKCIGLIAQKVLAGKKRLKRDADANILTGLIIVATWQVARHDGIQDIINSLKVAVQNNTRLKDESIDVKS